jgi:hypothetical protein
MRTRTAEEGRVMPEVHREQPEVVVVPRGEIVVRPVEERDIPDIINLLWLNYGEDYPDRELYDGKWVKRAVHNDNVCWLLAENKSTKEVLASGAIKLDYGDYDDQLGIIGRLVAHPKRRVSGLLPFGSIIVKELVAEAKKKVECVVSDARTERRTSQIMVEHEGLRAVGFLPGYKFFKRKPEDLIVYTDLYGEGRTLRSVKLPQVIPEVERLARHVLSAMNLPTAMGVVHDCPAYPSKAVCDFHEVDRVSLAQLRQLDRSRLSEPVVFANVSLDYGMAVLADKKVYHKMAVDDRRVVGAFGYSFDEANRIFHVTELVFTRPEIIDNLCGEVVNTAAAKEARIVEVDLSAYDARIQQTFLNYGFRPVAYIPAMVFHNTHRLDIVKMVKLGAPYKYRKMDLSREARKVVSLARRGLK